MITLAEYKFKFKSGGDIELNHRDGMAFLQHLLEFEKDLVFLVEVKYGHKMKFIIKK